MSRPELMMHVLKQLTTHTHGHTHRDTLFVFYWYHATTHYLAEKHVRIIFNDILIILITTKISALIKKVQIPE